MIKISLIIPTLGRDIELLPLLNSLVNQTFKEFELIIVDQNGDNRVNNVLKKFEGQLDYKHIKTEIRGAARARNIGITIATGKLITFPDDDCWYPYDLLKNVNRLFDEHSEWEAISGKLVDPEGKSGLGRWSKKDGLIDRYNLWTRHTEVTLFIRRYVFDKINGFDELLGVGAGTKWGSGESADLVLKMLGTDFKIYYNQNINIHHPITIDTAEINCFSEKVYKKTYHYALGMGYVMGRYKYPHWYILYFCIRPLSGGILELFKSYNKSKYYRLILKGRIKGYLAGRYKAKI